MFQLFLFFVPEIELMTYQVGAYAFELYPRSMVQLVNFMFLKFLVGTDVDRKTKDT